MTAVKESCVRLCWNQSGEVLGFVGARSGTSVVTVVATDADDPTYGNSARLMYSILQGQPYFSVEPKTGDHLCIERDPV